MRFASSRTPALAALLATLAAAQSVGPDVIVGDLNGVDSYGTSGGIAAYAVGTTSCNVGTVNLQWQAGTNLHPVIGQNAYRLKAGRFEQVGMSWLKHGFYALSQTLCGTCPNPTDGSTLGVGCSDPYVSSLNGGQTGLGPRSEVNASIGYFPFPFGGNPVYDPIIGRRLQIAVADVNPSQNAGASYFFEGQYVTPDDAQAGNKNNNCSWRRASFGAAPNYTAIFVGNTVRQQSALYGWQSIDPAVVITNYDIPNDGRFEIASRVTSLGGGQYRYFFCVHNMNSESSAQGFQVNFASSANITNLYFHDVPYHSGELFDGTDWTPTTTSNSVRWDTSAYCLNPNANALRWGSSYSFGFDANVANFSSWAITPFKDLTCPPTPVVPTLGTYTASNVPYTFVDISATGNAGPVGDDVAQTVNLGFTFSFYGQTYTQLQVSTNGYLCVPGADGTVYANTTIPSVGQPEGFIGVQWTDLITGSGFIKSKPMGTAPNRQFIVQYSGVQHYGTTNPESFEVILRENGDIFSTSVATTSGGADCTRGIENQNGTAGTQSSFNASGSVVPGTTIKYTLLTAIPTSADLYVIGNGAPNTILTFRAVSTARLSPLIMVASASQGPTHLGALGDLAVDVFNSVTIADGVGVFLPADPNARTNCACGKFDANIPMGTGGIPPGLTFYIQAVVLWTANTPGNGPQPPNGQFHITNQGVLNT